MDGAEPHGAIVGMASPPVGVRVATVGRPLHSVVPGAGPGTFLIALCRRNGEGAGAPDPCDDRDSGRVGRSRMRILFTTAPLQGHFFPLVPLAWAARLRGHDVLVAVADDFVPTAETSGLPVVGVGPGGRLDGLADPSAVHGITDARLAHGLAFARMAAANLAGVRAVVA